MYVYIWFSSEFRSALLCPRGCLFRLVPCLPSRRRVRYKSILSRSAHTLTRSLLGTPTHAVRGLSSPAAQGYRAREIGARLIQQRRRLYRSVLGSFFIFSWRAASPSAGFAWAHRRCSASGTDDPHPCSRPREFPVILLAACWICPTNHQISLASVYLKRNITFFVLLLTTYRYRRITG